MKVDVVKLDENKSYKEYKSKNLKGYRELSRKVLFRGHGSENYELLSTAGRQGSKLIPEEMQIKFEYELLKDFHKNCKEMNIFVPSYIDY